MSANKAGKAVPKLVQILELGQPIPCNAVTGNATILNLQLQA
jgi:hypothetical protein